MAEVIAIGAHFAIRETTKENFQLEFDTKCDNLIMKLTIKLGIIYTRRL